MGTLASIVITAILLCLNLEIVGSITCYRCVSSQPGCGKELNIRLQRRHSCPGTGTYGGENFCVKVVEKVGSDTVITRDCLMTLRHSTRHREKLPTVQRQNYCYPGRNNDPKNPYDNTKMFCFCNDWNGCNSSPGQIILMPLRAFVLSFVVLICVYMSTRSEMLL